MIQGGNDSFGTGIGAGGAQVMGQSAGLNDLVKVAMQRPRQQRLLPNMPINAIDTSKIKNADAPEITKGMEDYRNYTIQGNLTQDIGQKAQLYTKANNSFANVMELARVSQNNQAELIGYKKNVNEPTFDSSQIDPYNKHINEFALAKSGSAEEQAAREQLPLGNYQKIDTVGMENALSKEVVKSAHMDTQQFAPGGVKRMNYQEDRVASGDAMMGTTQMFSDGNRATANMFSNQGKDIMANPGNAEYLQNLQNKYRIDPTNANAVGRANYVDHKVEAEKNYDVSRDSWTYPGKPTSISISSGGEKPPVAQPLNSVTTVNATQPNGSKTLEVYQKTLKNLAGLPPHSSIPAGRVYDGKTNSWIDMKGLTDATLMGGLVEMYHYRPGQKLSGIGEDGKPINRPANEGAVSRNIVDQIKENPKSIFATNFTRREMIPVRGKDINGNIKEYFVMPDMVGQAGFPTTAKGTGNKAAVAQEAADQFKAATQKINATSQPNKYITTNKAGKKSINN